MHCHQSVSTLDVFQEYQIYTAKSLLQRSRPRIQLGYILKKSPRNRYSNQDSDISHGNPDQFFLFCPKYVILLSTSHRKHFGTNHYTSGFARPLPICKNKAFRYRWQNVQRKMAKLGVKLHEISWSRIWLISFVKYLYHMHEKEHYNLQYSLLRNGWGEKLKFCQLCRQFSVIVLKKKLGAITYMSLAWVQSVEWFRVLWDAPIFKSCNKIKT